MQKLRAPVDKEYKEYQKEGILFAINKPGNILIADEMGLGKTVQALGVINNSEYATKVLIICPASLMCNWWKEIDEWLVDKPSIDVVSYDECAKINPIGIDILIVDEAHYTKNSKAQRTQHVKRIAKNSKKVIYLTGTPIDGKPLELFSLLQVLDPKTWDPAGKIKIGSRYQLVNDGEGAGFWNFAKRYCDAKQKYVGKNKKVWVFDGASNLEELNEKLQSIMIRRMKKDVLKELPPKRHHIVLLPKTKIKISDDLEHVLAYVENSYVNGDSGWSTTPADDNYEKNIKALRADKVAFEEFSKKRHEQGLEKVEFVVQHVHRCLEETDKIILFCRHKDVQEKLMGVLNFITECVWINSEMSPAERAQSVDIFMTDPKVKIIIGTIDTMGVGLTLTAASLVIFAELDSMPGKMAQASDRAHRIGQENSVLVQYLVQDGSIDARMCKILIKKQKVLERLLNSQPVDKNENWTMTVEIPPPNARVSVLDIEQKPSAYSATACKHGRVIVVGSRYRCADCNDIMR